MEKVHHQGQQLQQQQQQQGWRSSKCLSFKNATILVSCFNFLLIIFLLQSFISSSSFAKKPSSFHPPTTTSAKLLKHIRESQEMRRAMVPIDLIKRVREIEKESLVDIEPQKVEQKDTKQTAAVHLVSRLNNFRSYSDAGSSKAIEEWRKRKMERARQRELGKNGTIVM